MKKGDALSAFWLLGAVGLGSLALLSRPSPSPVPAPPPLPLEDYATLQRQTRCDPTPKPGVVAFRDAVLRQFGGHDLGIVRDCAVGGVSEHKEGRAWDWGIPHHAAADAMLRWLLDPDAHGRPHARLRRAGVMYVIYNRHIWRAHRERDWRPYTGKDPHVGHVHLSFSWAGARGMTSFYELLRAVA